MTIRIIKAIIYSVEGLKAAFASEAAFRQEVILLPFLIVIALMVEASAAERALMIGSLFLVLIAEIMNTAIETVIERISSEIHPLSKKAKDLGSAAVMLSIFNVIAVWGIILYDNR